MKNSDEMIERVLAGLRDADAPDGMERRILDELEERAAARSRQGWRWMRPMWLVAPTRPVAARAVACGVAVAGLLVVLAVPAVRRLGHAPLSKLQSKASTSPTNTSPTERVAVALNAAAVNNVGASAPGHGVRSIETANAQKASLVRALVRGNGSNDSAAANDMQAASFPAPPMPLTEQERLLLRIAHRGDPVELALLSPRLRAVEDAEEKAEFQRFFGPSTAKQAPQEQPTTEQPIPEEATPTQPAPEELSPEKFVPDQSTTQQPTPTQTRTGDNQ
jgi:hypothetical protein